jgi:phosphoenolpyruvate carboxykinase (GTP)
MTIDRLKHGGLKKWIEEAAALMTPDAIEVCDGSQAEYDRMIQITLDNGLATPLNPEKRPGCVLYRSDPSDVARVEGRTYIASQSKDDAGPTNNWIDPAELKKTMKEL